MRVLGVDPGSHITGYGVVDRTGNQYGRPRFGVIRGRTGSLSDRLARIHEGLTRVLRDEHPDVVAVESAFYAKSVRSTLILGHVRGVVLLAVRHAGAELFEYAPREVKSSVVGSGGASKEQVQFMIRRLLAVGDDLPGDAADALAVAICHHHRSSLVTVR